MKLCHFAKDIDPDDHVIHLSQDISAPWQPFGFGHGWDIAPE